ncbi:MAG: hypothetical protein AB1546_15655 [bacterium]
MLKVKNLTHEYADFIIDGMSPSEMVDMLMEVNGASYKSAIGIVNDTIGDNYVVIGAWAVSYYTTPRATADIDLMIRKGYYEKLIDRFRTSGAVINEYSSTAAQVIYGKVNLHLLEIMPEQHFLLDNKVADKLGDEKIYYLEKNNLIAVKISSIMSPDRSAIQTKQDELDMMKLMEKDTDIKSKHNIDRIKETLMKLGASSDYAEKLIGEFILK